MIKKELIKNINEIKNILEQATIILNINENEEEEKIAFELNLNPNLEDINSLDFFLQKGEDTFCLYYYIYDRYSNLIEKYKSLILFVEEIKKRAKYKFPKDKFTIKLNIKNSFICDYYIYDELYDLKNKNIIYRDNNILKENNNYPGLELFLDNIIKKNN